MSRKYKSKAYKDLYVPDRNFRSTQFTNRPSKKQKNSNESVAITFVTGNKEKLKNMQSYMEAICPSVQLNSFKIDLPELQSLDAEKVIQTKLEAAKAKIPRKKIIVEDSAFEISGLNKFPGALVKFVLKSMGLKEMTKLWNGKEATMISVIGYFDGTDDYIFTGKVLGTITKKPIGSGGHGWDSIVRPKGIKKTYAEMSDDERRKFLPKKISAEKLASHVQKVVVGGR